MNDHLMMQAALHGNIEAQRRLFAGASCLEYPEHYIAPVISVFSSTSNGVVPSISVKGKVINDPYAPTEIEHSQSPSVKEDIKPPLVINGEIDEAEFERRMLAATNKERSK